MLNYSNDYDPTLALFDDFRRRMGRLFDGYEPAYGFGRAVDGRPEMTLKDDAKQLVIIARVPGIPLESLKVSLHDDALTISGERKSDLPEGYKVHRRERALMQFSRTFNLPVKIDAEKTRAELKDGVLTLTLEKAAEAQPRQIAVKAA